MDAEGFDRLVKAFRHRTHRRRVAQMTGIAIGVAATGLLGAGNHESLAARSNDIPGTCPPETTPCFANATRGAKNRNQNLQCCSREQVCLKCSIGRVSPEPENTITIAVALCCTPGVDCDFYEDHYDAKGRHLSCGRSGVIDS